MYVDDLVVKPLRSNDHAKDVEQNFQVLRYHRMKAKPSQRHVLCFPWTLPRVCDLSMRIRSKSNEDKSDP